MRTTTNDRPNFSTLFRDAFLTGAWYGTRPAHQLSQVVTAPRVLLAEAINSRDESDSLIDMGDVLFSLSILPSAVECGVEWGVANPGRVAGALAGAILLTLPLACAATFTREFQNNATFEAILVALREITDDAIKEQILNEIIYDDHNRSLGLRSYESHRLMKMLRRSHFSDGFDPGEESKNSFRVRPDDGVRLQLQVVWEELLNYLGEKTNEGFYRNNGKKLFRTILGAKTVQNIAQHNKIETPNALLTLLVKIKMMLREEHRTYRRTSADPKTINVFFNLLLQTKTADIDEPTRFAILTLKNALRSHLKNYINEFHKEQKGQVALLAESDTMLAAFIDHQTGVFTAQKTMTRRQVDELITQHCAVVVAAVAHPVVPVEKIPEMEQKPISTRDQLRNDIESAIKKLENPRFDSLGKEERTHKLNVLRAARDFLTYYNELSADNFVQTVSNNPRYAHTFQPGKTAETVKLVNRVVALCPELQAKIADKINRLETKENAAKASAPSLRIFRQEDPALSALRAITVPTSGLQPESLALGVRI